MNQSTIILDITMVIAAIWLLATLYMLLPAWRTWRNVRNIAPSIAQDLNGLRFGQFRNRWAGAGVFLALAGVFVSVLGNLVYTFGRCIPEKETGEVRCAMVPNFVGEMALAAELSFLAVVVVIGPAYFLAMLGLERFTRKSMQRRAKSTLDLSI